MTQQCWPTKSTSCRDSTTSLHRIFPRRLSIGVLDYVKRCLFISVFVQSKKQIKTKIPTMKIDKFIRNIRSTKLVHCWVSWTTSDRQFVSCEHFFAIVNTEILLIKTKNEKCNNQACPKPISKKFRQAELSEFHLCKNAKNLFMLLCRDRLSIHGNLAKTFVNSPSYLTNVN